MNRDEEIRRLEESITRMEEADDDEVDSSEYQRLLSLLVELRSGSSPPATFPTSGPVKE